MRGDLTADGVPVQDSRLLCIPVLVDAEGGASSPEDRLFVDVVHVVLTRKDTAQVFDVPLPPSKSGDSVHRAMYVTLAWFSPMESSRARYPGPIFPGR